MIALLDAFFTVLGALATVFACLFGVALLRESYRMGRQNAPVREYPPLRAVRDDLADRRAMRSSEGWVA